MGGQVATDDIGCMRAALLLARRGDGHVSPNPLVGAVLVMHGRIVAGGFHARYGGPHAEVACLSGYRGDLRQATLYVTLEPCVHFGKTPPCADMIIHAGVGRVVVAMQDPNPVVSGLGINRMRRAGIAVQVGVLEHEARELNRFFLKHILQQRPYVHVKIAQTLDGFIAGGRSRWISSAVSRRLVHRWRADHDAVLIGAGTVREDDPSITVRQVRGRDPHVVILDGRLSLPTRSRVFAERRGRQVFLCVERDALTRRRRKARSLTHRGVLILPFRGQDGRVPLRALLRELYILRIGSLLVEGGAEVFTQFISEGLADEVSVFIAPRLFGTGVRAFTASMVDGETLTRGKAPFRAASVSGHLLGGDLLIHLRAHHPLSSEE